MSPSALVPRVLVVVPTLGQRVAYLRQTVASIRSQRGVDVDLVLVVPSGTEADAIAAEAGARIVRDPRRGLSGALNAGLAAATPGTELFGWLGDDDLLRPGSLEAAAAALDRVPGAAMAYGWCDYIDDEGRTFFVSKAGPWAARVLSWGPNLIPQPGSLMNLPMVESVGGLDEGLRYSMDLDLFLKLRKRGALVCVPRSLAAFRWHSDSLTVSQQKASMDEADAVRRRLLPAPASATWPVWRWPVRWALSGAKAVVSRRAIGARGCTGTPLSGT